MMRIILAGFLGAIALFVWGFLSWEVLPFHSKSLRTLPNEDSVVAVLRSGNVESGTYIIPGMADEKGGAEAKKAQVEKMKRGPVAMLHYSNTGYADGDAMYLIKGFLVYFFAAMVAASMLGKLSWSLAAKYSARVRFIMTIGIFLAIAARLSDWAFFGYGTGITLTLAVDDIVGWTLAGLLIAWRMKPLMAKTI